MRASYLNINLLIIFQEMIFIFRCDRSNSKLAYKILLHSRHSSFAKEKFIRLGTRNGRNKLHPHQCCMQYTFALARTRPKARDVSVSCIQPLMVTLNFTTYGDDWRVVLKISPKLFMDGCLMFCRPFCCTYLKIYIIAHAWPLSRAHASEDILHTTEYSLNMWLWKFEIEI